MTTDKQLSLKPVAGTIVLASPSDSAQHRITPRDRALSAMTDLRQRDPVTVHRDVGIDDALRQMMHAGVRLMFVLDQGSELVGLISSYDIQGEKPLRFLQSIGCNHRSCRHADVHVSDVMEPVEAWQALAFSDVAHASVGDVVATFRATGRSHIVVVEHDAGPARDVVRGLFSATQVGRQLGTTIETQATAVTFAQIETALSDAFALA